ncbi:hypothetical protein AMELA_G00051190 [Ameiurus melas]|uniref:Uncharacterized protein n=1 Tax=Ameiurus melas TaxID=219545 RepID=A0A7J6B7M5_AMEME|nr:hypothetical protein AMELA_G00051190 [Ameiurus melas]
MRNALPRIYTWKVILNRNRASLVSTATRGFIPRDCAVKHLNTEARDLNTEARDHSLFPTRIFTSFRCESTWSLRCAESARAAAQ